VSTINLDLASTTTRTLGGLDVAGYVDLTLSAADAQTLITRAITTARAGRLSDWIVREGQTETVLLELLCQVIAELGYDLNQLPGYVLELLLRLFGLTRDPGQTARTSVTFAVALSASDTLIGAGALVVLVPADGTSPVTFATTEDVTVPAGTRFATVPATATSIGADVNGTPAGTRLQVLSALTAVDGAVLASEVTGGTAREDSAAFLSRGTPRLSRLVETLVRPEHFTAAALETPGVTRALALDFYNGDIGSTPGNGGGPPGTVRGHITVAVAGAHGSHLDITDLEDLRASLQSRTFVLITAHAVNADIISLDVAATIVPVTGYNAGEVQANVTTALTAYLSPDAAAWGGVIYVNELISLIDGVVGVERVVSIDYLGPAGQTSTQSGSSPATPVGDYTLPGIAPLPRLGTATVTVVPLAGSNAGSGAGAS
jgi:uncharacterized phage protein gp47/JayE